MNEHRFGNTIKGKTNHLNNLYFSQNLCVLSSLFFCVFFSLRMFTFFSALYAPDVVSMFTKFLNRRNKRKLFQWFSVSFTMKPLNLVLLMLKMVMNMHMCCMCIVVIAAAAAASVRMNARTRKRNANKMLEFKFLFTERRNARANTEHRYCSCQEL